MTNIDYQILRLPIDGVYSPGSIYEKKEQKKGINNICLCEGAIGLIKIKISFIIHWEAKLMNKLFFRE